MRGWQHVTCDLCGDGERVFEDDDRGWEIGVPVALDTTTDPAEVIEGNLCPSCARKELMP